MYMNMMVILSMEIKMDSEHKYIKKIKLKKYIQVIIKMEKEMEEVI